LKPNAPHLAGQEAPGPKGCPFAGSLPALAWHILRFFEAITATYGDIVLFKLGRKKVYLISHPHDLATLYAEERQGYYSREFFHEPYRASFGNGIFNSYGEAWKKQRSILQPYFQKRESEAWFPIIHAETQRALQALADSQSKTVQAEQMTLPLIQAIMSRILFGQPLEDDDSRQAIAAINTVSQHNVVRLIRAFIFNGVLNRLPTPGNRKFNQALVNINQAMTNLRLKAEAAGDDACLISKLAPHFNPQELRDHLFTLFFGGQDTTVNAIAFTFYYLAQHPAIQQRARDEIQGVLATSGQLTYADLNQLPFIDSVINESMRLSPPAYASYRDVVGAQQMRGFSIDDQALLVFSPYLTHRHQEVWPDPERFDPERFMSGTGVDKFAFMPYGGGQRICLGLHLARVEILTVVALFLNQFQWTLPANFKATFIPHMTLKARKGITLTLLD
jgi:enediyne biosynthesis protein E7